MVFYLQTKNIKTMISHRKVKFENIYNCTLPMPTSSLKNLCNNICSIKYNHLCKKQYKIKMKGAKSNIQRYQIFYFNYILSKQNQVFNK